MKLTPPPGRKLTVIPPAGGVLVQGFATELGVVAAPFDPGSGGNSSRRVVVVGRPGKLFRFGVAAPPVLGGKLSRFGATAPPVPGSGGNSSRRVVLVGEAGRGVVGTSGRLSRLGTAGVGRVGKAGKASGVTEAGRDWGVTLPGRLLMGVGVGCIGTALVGRIVALVGCVGRTVVVTASSAFFLFDLNKFENPLKNPPDFFVVVGVGVVVVVVGTLFS
jgi:hypothetical protein